MDTDLAFAGRGPSGRSGIWMFYHAGPRQGVRVRIVSSGGFKIWEYDPEVNNWMDRTVVSPPTGVSRSYFDVAFDCIRGKIVEARWLPGPNGYNTDVWERDYDQGVWAQAMPATGVGGPGWALLPHGRLRFGPGGCVLLVGGYDRSPAERRRQRFVGVGH